MSLVHPTPTILPTETLVHNELHTTPLVFIPNDSVYETLESAYGGPFEVTTRVNESFHPEA